MKKKHTHIFVLSLLLLLLTSLLFWLDIKSIPSIMGIDLNRLNFDFWGIYVAFIGNLIAGALTLYGVIITIKAQRQEKKDETQRLVMPMLQIGIGEYDYKWKYIQFDFNLTAESKQRTRKDIPNTEEVTLEIKNIGTRELLELHIGNFSSTFFDEGGKYYSLYPILYSNNAIMLNLCLYEKGTYDKDAEEDKFDTLISPISFSCYFKDCLGNWYKQDFSISMMHSITEGIPMNEKALSANIERCQIDSAPIGISEKELPWILSSEKLVQC